MKKFIKLLPAAVALVALSSCSNEDLFSGAQETNYTKTLEVTHEGINDFTGTRSSMVPTDGNKVLYDVNDVIRVYDESITLFDKYVFDGTKFGTTGTNVSNAKYAIFPSEQVKWGDSEGDPKVAVVIKDEVDLSSTVNGTEVGGVKAFVANIPSWGIVKEGATKDKLEVSLYDMTGILRVAIQSLKGDPDGNFLKIESDANGDEKFNNITGAFAATLDKNIANTQKNTTTQLAADPTLAGGNTMWVNLGTEAITDAYVYLPIIAGTYDDEDVKVTLYQGGTGTGATVTPLKTFKANSGNKRVFKRGGVYAAGVIGENKVEVSESDPYNIQAIIEANKNKGMDVTVDVKYADGVSLATSNNADAKNHTITIPADLNNNIVLNIKAGANHNIEAKPLTITGGKAGKTVTFNFIVEGGNGKVTGANAAAEKLNGDVQSGIVIDSKSDIVLTGTIETSIDVRSTNTGKVTLGTTDAAFTWAEAAGNNRTLVFKGGDLTVQKIANITDIVYAATGTVTANANLTTLTANAVGVTPTAVNVNDATVGTVTTKAAKINVTRASVGILNAEYGAEDITLVDGKVTTKLTAEDSYAAGKTVNVASSGISAIEAATAPFNCTYAFTSTWDIPTTKTIDNVKDGATLGAGKKIYTAAQLVNAVADAQLMTDVTFAAKSLTFKGADLTGSFDGNKKTITGLTAPLFGSLTMAANSTIKDLTLKDVSIVTNDDKVGALIGENKVADGKTLTLTNIVVNGGTIGTSSAVVATQNIGGLIGLNKANVTFDKCQVIATVKGFANIGGFIGQSTKDATALTIKGKKASNVTFAKTYTATTYTGEQLKLLGTVGNFIGSVTIDDAVVTINVGDNSSENAFSNYFTNTINKEALEFGLHKNAAEKSFVGMDGNWIGFSPIDGGSLTIKYKGKDGQTREDADHQEINIFK